MDAPPQKLLGLEILRFCCALAVVLNHYKFFAESAGAGALDFAHYPLSPFLAPLYQWGQLGLQLFWMISGFVFVWKYGEVIAGHAISARKFLWLRLSRLYPLHFVTLLLVGALQPVHVLLTGHSFVYGPNDGVQFALNLAMATQWGLIAPQTFNGPFWSVSAEVLIYAVFFGVVWRFGSSIVVCALAMLAATGLVMLADLPAAFCAMMFFAGGITALLFAEHGRSPRAVVIAFVMLMAALAAISATLMSGVTLSPRMLPMWVAPPLMFLMACDGKLLDRFARPIEAAGNLTYSTYLCHFPMQLALAIAVAVFEIELPLSSPAFLAVYLGAVLIVGRLVFVAFERPAQDWIRAAMLTPRAEPATN